MVRITPHHQLLSNTLSLCRYLNSRTVPIYQWIPPSHPQGLGSLRHKLNLDHEVTADPYSRHALHQVRCDTDDLETILNIAYMSGYNTRATCN